MAVWGVGRVPLPPLQPGKKSVTCWVETQPAYLGGFFLDFSFWLKL